MYTTRKTRRGAGNRCSSSYAAAWQAHYEVDRALSPGPCAWTPHDADSGPRNPQLSVLEAGAPAPGTSATAVANAKTCARRLKRSRSPRISRDRRRSGPS